MTMPHTRKPHSFAWPDTERRSFMKVLLAGAGSLCLPMSFAEAQAKQKVLRVGMTLSDIPYTAGQTNGGAEGLRFVSMSMYDALIAWDIDQGDKPTKLRPGVKFHDGSAFNAKTVVWNIERLTKPDVPHYDKRQAVQAGNYMATVDHAEAIDDMTVKIITKVPDATLSYSMSNIYFSSPAHFEALGRDWDKFALNPSGTGPWKFDRMVPRERLEMVRNASYWDAKRIPKCDRLVLRPIADATTRIAALMSGQIDWVE